MNLVRRRRRRLLINEGLALAYLLRDEFFTAAGAPLGSTINMEPGPGQWTVTDTANHVSKSGGALQFNGQVANFTDPRLVGTSKSRVIGRAFLASVIQTAQDAIIGWATANTGATAVSVGTLVQAAASLGLLYDNSGVTINIATVANGTSYKYALVLFSSGIGVFIKGGAFSSWTILFLTFYDSTATLFPIIQQAIAACQFSVDFARIADLGGAFSTDFGIATYTNTSLSSGNTFTGTADCLPIFQFTLSGGPAANDEIAMEYRRTDANNKWKAYIKRNAGNTAWDFNLDSVLAGTPTNRINVTGVGTPDAIQVTVQGTKHNCYTRQGTVWTQRGAEINLSHQDAITGQAVVYVAGTTATRMSSFPRTSSQYAILDAI